MISDGNPMRTVFGNTIDTGMPFNGYLRELRIWSTSRSIY